MVAVVILCMGGLFGDGGLRGVRLQPTRHVNHAHDAPGRICVAYISRSKPIATTRTPPASVTGGVSAVLDSVVVMTVAVVICLFGRLIDNRRLNGAGLQPTRAGAAHTSFHTHGRNRFA
jgi:hypothetical protein